MAQRYAAEPRFDSLLGGASAGTAMSERPSGRAGRAGRSRRMNLPPGFGTIWLSVAIDLVGFGIVLPILPLYAKRFGASAVTATALIAAFSAAQFVCSPLLGRLSDRI